MSLDAQINRGNTPFMGNFDVAKMKQRWWSGIACVAPLESELELEDEDSAYTLSIEELRNSYF